MLDDYLSWYFTSTTAVRLILLFILIKSLRNRNPISTLNANIDSIRCQILNMFNHLMTTNIAKSVDLSLAFLQNIFSALYVFQKRSTTR